MAEENEQINPDIIKSDNYFLHKREEIKPINHYTLFVGEIIDDIELRSILNQLWNGSNEDTLRIRINSTGGAIDVGLQLVNLIQSWDNVITIIDSIAYSMAALIFCQGEERYIYETSSLMFHNFSGWFEGKGHEVIGEVAHASKVFKKMFKKVLTPFLTEEEQNKMIDDGKDFWFDSIEMCERNIATHILVDGELLTAKEYLDKQTNDINKSK